MSLAAAGDAFVVLDQINGRAVRYGRDGRVLGTNRRSSDDAGSRRRRRRHARAPRSAGREDGDRHRSARADDRRLPARGDPGLLTGIFVDGKTVYVEKEHGALVPIAAPTVVRSKGRRTSRAARARMARCCCRPRSPPRRASGLAQRIRSREGASRFARLYQLAPPTRVIVLLDTDARGTILPRRGLGSASADRVHRSGRRSRDRPCRRSAQRRPGGVVQDIVVSNDGTIVLAVCAPNKASSIERRRVLSARMRAIGAARAPTSRRAASVRAAAMRRLGDDGRPSRPRYERVEPRLRRRAREALRRDRRATDPCSPRRVRARHPPQARSGCGRSARPRNAPCRRSERDAAAIAPATHRATARGGEQRLRVTPTQRAADQPSRIDVYTITLTRPSSMPSTGVPSTRCHAPTCGGSSATSGHTAAEVATPRDAKLDERRSARSRSATAKRIACTLGPCARELAWIACGERARLRERRLEIDEHLAERRPCGRRARSRCDARGRKRGGVRGARPTAVRVGEHRHTASGTPPSASVSATRGRSPRCHGRTASTIESP